MQALNNKYKNIYSCTKHKLIPKHKEAQYIKAKTDFKDQFFKMIVLQKKVDKFDTLFDKEENEGYIKGKINVFLLISRQQNSRMLLSLLKFLYHK